MDQVLEQVSPGQELTEIPVRPEAKPPKSSAKFFGSKKGGRPAGAVVAPKRDRDIYWILAGLALVVLSGLMAASVLQAQDDSVEVLMAQRFIGEGEAVGDDDLVSIRISVDDGSNLLSGGVQAQMVPASQRDSLIGLRATGPIGQGSLIHRDQFFDEPREDETTVVLGAALSPGQYPRTGIKPGNTVRIWSVSLANGFDDVQGGLAELAEGEVVAVTELAATDNLLVSVRVPESVAGIISDRAQANRIRMVLVDKGFPDEAVEPLTPAEPAEPEEPADVEVDQTEPADPDGGGDTAEPTETEGAVPADEGGGEGQP